ncbi:hypothetical protein GCM10007170_03360 [Arthrobacter liuii]|uniref:Uncharacterized protein n=1 Tax=Arthrobacter liuii TaxID=1476996 RepID=A0ABQ2AGH6_9MICC|nr:hypothetical protein GCM10007170_03360 [Arthrobacter liuii]
MATTQPTTSFWLAAKITATTKAVTRTIRPGPLMRIMENPPLADLEDDEELPKVRMQLLSQRADCAPVPSTPGEHTRSPAQLGSANCRFAGP